MVHQFGIGDDLSRSFTSFAEINDVDSKYFSNCVVVANWIIALNRSPCRMEWKFIQLLAINKKFDYQLHATSVYQAGFYQVFMNSWTRSSVSVSDDFIRYPTIGSPHLFSNKTSENFSFQAVDRLAITVRSTAGSPARKRLMLFDSIEELYQSGSFSHEDRTVRIEVVICLLPSLFFS